MLVDELGTRDRIPVNNVSSQPIVWDIGCRDRSPTYALTSTR
ncbi:hypothetical protein [Coleofasciculus sp. F4-SAH-05]